jgi:ABC-type nitrate/sulfonate/bicarbonate transport system permease component
MLLVGLVHMVTHSYGADFLRIMSSIYPGADTAPTLGRVLLGTVYGFADGAIAGFLFGLLYHSFTGGHRLLTK